MKKAFMLVAAIALIATPIFAQDEAPTLGGLHGATGSVEFSFGDDVIGSGDGFGFSGDSDGSTTGSITASIATEKVEAGATISLVPSVALNENDDTVDTDAINTDAIDAAIDWYETAEGDNYGPFTTAINWETTIGDTAIYTTADGWGIDDAEIDTQAEWNTVYGRLQNVVNAIIAEINALDGTATYTYGQAVGAGYATEVYGDLTDIVDGTSGIAITADATAAELAAMNAVDEASADFNDAYYGVDGDDTYDVSYPVSSAYFRLLAVAGVVDVEFELNGKNVGVGSKFTEATDDDPLHLGVGLALTEGVIEGLSASVLYTNAASTEAVADDLTTYDSDETDDAGAAVNAIQVKAGYATDMFNAGVEMAIADFAAPELWFSLMGGVSLTDLAGLTADVEFTKMSAGNGMGIAVGVGASILGITPAVDFRYHMAGTDLTDSATLGVAYDDTTDDETALAYFNSALAANGYLGIGLVVDFTEIMGMSLITLDGGFAMVFGGGNDWNVGIAFDLTEIVFPVTVSGGFASAYDDVMSWNAGVSTEFVGITAALAVADDIDDADTALTFDVSLGYTYDVVDLSAAFGINADAEKSFSITAGVSF